MEVKKMFNEYKISLATSLKDNKALAGEELQSFINDFKATADNEEIRKSFAASLAVPILKAVAPQSSVRDIFMVDELPAGSLAEYPIDLDDIEVATVMPRLGAVPQNLVVGDSLIVPTFEVANSVEWKLAFVRDARFNIVERALEKLAESFVRAEEKAGWDTIRGAKDTTNTIAIGSETGLTRKLFNKMITDMRAIGACEPNVIYVSPKRASQIRDWGASDIDDTTRRELFVKGGMGSIYGVEIRELRSLGDNEVFMFDTTKLGVMPIRTKMTSYDKPDSINRLRAGVLAWEEIGFAVIDKRAMRVCDTLPGLPA
jgi:hypothetical protein